MSIKVTVVVLTYNHELYIAQALESILSQEVDFKIQIIVADDGSTDGTKSIINDLLSAHPDKFSVLGKESNHGVRVNVLNCFDEIKGEYIAILDGDDYWSDNRKLKRQVDFLEENQDFNGVFHDAEILHIDSVKTKLFSQKKYYSQCYVFNEIVFISDLIARKMILPSSSALIRSSILKLLDKSLLEDNYSILWKVTCFGIKKSKFYFINEPLSVYRNHNKGISKSAFVQFHLSHINFLQNLLRDDYFQYYKYDIYYSLSIEYKILLDSKPNSLNKRMLFRNYILFEICKLWYYRKQLFKK